VDGYKDNKEERLSLNTANIEDLKSLFKLHSKVNGADTRKAATATVAEKKGGSKPAMTHTNIGALASMHKTQQEDFTRHLRGSTSALSSSASKVLGTVVPDRSGFGGHTQTCKGMGVMSPDACRGALIAHAPSSGIGGGDSFTCDVLSFKDGKCFLHNSRASGFYSDNSPGHWMQRTQ